MSYLDGFFTTIVRVGQNVVARIGGAMGGQLIIGSTLTATPQPDGGMQLDAAPAPPASGVVAPTPSTLAQRDTDGSLHATGVSSSTNLALLPTVGLLRTTDVAQSIAAYHRTGDAKDVPWVQYIHAGDTIQIGDTGSPITPAPAQFAIRVATTGYITLSRGLFGSASMVLGSTSLAFYGGAPVAQPAAVAQLTDNTGGAPSAALAAIAAGAAYTQADMQAVRDALASLAANVNALSAALSAAGGGVGITA